MQKKIIVISLVAVMIVAVVALLRYRTEVEWQLAELDDQPGISTAEPELETMAAAEDEIFESEDFNILLPAGWEGYQDFGQVFLAFKNIGSEEQPEELLIMVENFSREGMDLDELKASVEEEIAEYGEGNTWIDVEEDRVVDGRPAKYLEMGASIEGREVLRALVFIQDEEDFWGVFMDMPPNEWLNQQTVFERVVESFELR